MIHIYIHVPEMTVYHQSVRYMGKELFSLSSDYITTDDITICTTDDIIISSYLADIQYARNSNSAHLLILSETDNYIQPPCINGSSSDNTFTNNDNYVSDYILEDASALDMSYIEEIICRHKGIPVTIGYTERLILRELTCNDIHELYLVKSKKNGKEDICNICYDGNLDEVLELHRKYIDYQYSFYGFGYWGLFLKENNRLIGRCGFEMKDINNYYVAECGYYIIPEYRRLGYAYEAMNFVINLAYNRFYLDCLYAVISKNNSVSLHLSEKLGFHICKDEVILRDSKDCFILCHNNPITDCLNQTVQSGT